MRKLEEIKALPLELTLGIIKAGISGIANSAAQGEI